jgi:hypothetical protein
MTKINRIDAHPRGRLLLFPYLCWYFVVRYSLLGPYPDNFMSLAKCILVGNLLFVICLIVFHRKDLYMHMHKFLTANSVDCVYRKFHVSFRTWRTDDYHVHYEVVDAGQWYASE